MADYITLLGAEEVSRAASTMVGAAADMQNASHSFRYAVDDQQRHLASFIEQFTLLVERMEKVGAIQGPSTLELKI